MTLNCLQPTPPLPPLLVFHSFPFRSSCLDSPLSFPWFFVFNFLLLHFCSLLAYRSIRQSFVTRGCIVFWFLSCCFPLWSFVPIFLHLPVWLFDSVSNLSGFFPAFLLCNLEVQMNLVTPPMYSLSVYIFSIARCVRLFHNISILLNFFYLLSLDFLPSFLQIFHKSS